jgi:ribosomal protein S18 acetylase RimI-like enzyme
MTSAACICVEPAGEGDRAFLCELFAGTRADEFAHMTWSAEQQASFLRMQFEAQDRHYRENYPDGQFLVIVEDGRRIGRLYVEDREDEIRLMEISLVPEYRGRGIGGALVREIVARAESSGRGVTLHVEVNNPARRLYERLGFREVSESGIYVRMERRPSAGRGVGE